MCRVRSAQTHQVSSFPHNSEEKHKGEKLSGDNDGNDRHDDDAIRQDIPLSRLILEEKIKPNLVLKSKRMCGFFS